MRSSWWRVLVLIVSAAAFVLLASSYADAQCAMCRAALTAANERFARNFNIGVLVLLVPPAAIFCSIFIVLKRYGPQMNADDADQNKTDP